MIYLDQKNYDLALQYALKSNAISIKINDQNLYSNSLSLLGEVYREKGNYKKLKNIFLKLMIFKKR
ncbi:tetratricopeptide repeat protein [Flavobacterium piscinae]|uniref:tetratricopeptide repeat protein n=1 Tax=Flavobacterium piscinae TaxID=2506424 RepID=UPI0019877596|nr:tetratricopeptide repeat protein [Flavobacterium piscinae]MBC8883906.1 tetratricopeptide repeat protein [Flavobacterium piscinae]